MSADHDASSAGVSTGVESSTGTISDPTQTHKSELPRVATEAAQNHRRAEMYNPTHQAVNSFMPITEGSIWQGRLEENKNKRVVVVDASDLNAIRLKDTMSTRTGTVTIGTLMSRYQRADQQQTLSESTVEAKDAPTTEAPAAPASGVVDHAGASIDLRPVVVGDVLVGRHSDNKDRQIKILEVEANRVHARHRDGGRLSWISAATVYDRYTLPSDRSIRLTVGDEDPTDRRVRTPRAARPATPANETQATEASTPKAEEAQAPASAPAAEPDDAEPVNKVTRGVELSVVNGWDIYTHRATREPTVRDLDVAERAGLAKPRDIRTTIKDLISSGELTGIPDGTNIAGSDGDDVSPRAYIVKVDVSIGNNGTVKVDEYHLNEAGMAILAMHLRTPKAALLRRSIAQTFVLVRQGKLEEAARVATGKAPSSQPDGLPPFLQAQLATIDRLLAEGAIDSKTAAVQCALAVSKATGMDLITPPNVTFGKWSPAAEAINDLAPGESVVYTKPKNVKDHLSAEGIAHKVPFAKARMVGALARAIGIHGDTGADSGMGTFVPVAFNGQEQKEQWRYSPEAIEILVPLLSEVVTAIQANPRVKQETIISQVATKYLTAPKSSSAAE